MSEQPVILRYEGDGEFRPVSGYWASQCDRHFVVGEQYRMTEFHERSAASHSHYFAVINEAFATLPDHMRDEYPTVEHLRKKALIRKGYADERSIVCANKAEANRLAAFMKPLDSYAIIAPSEAVVKAWTAQSQSKKAMGAKAFQESKQAVLDFIDDLLGVERGESARAAGYTPEHKPSDQSPQGSDAAGGNDVTGEGSGGSPPNAAPDNSAEAETSEAGAQTLTEQKAADNQSSVPVSELSDEDRAWLKTAAKMLWAATGVGEPDILNRQDKGLREDFTPETVSKAARDRATSILQKCKSVCFRERSAADVLPEVALTACCDVKDVV